MKPALSLFLLCFTQLLLAQVTCPFHIENCQGGCGRFIDMDGDGYCDFTVITQFQQPQVMDTTNNVQQQTSQSPKIKNTQVTQEQTFEIYYLAPEYTPRTRALKAVQPIRNRSYRFVLWTTLAFALYGISIFLVRVQVYTKKTHRRIWNVLLLITFLVSGILGLLLVLQINYGILPSWYRDFLRWHVEFGIGMAWIGIFHALWHYSYYKHIFSKKQKNEDCQ